MPRLTTDTPVLGAALDACRRHFLYAFLFSALLNLLFIVPMLYMLQVYDRVIPTAGGGTLFFLTLVLLFALSTLALLDLTRSRLLVRASIRLDRLLSAAIMNSTLSRPDLSGQRLSKQALREFDTLRQVLTGPAILALFDAPWAPVYVVIGFLIHPWLGVLALIGAGLSVYLAWRTERSTSERLQQANEAAGRVYSGYDFTVAAAETVRALGLRRALVADHEQHRIRMMELQTEASLQSSRLTAISKFLRLALQSLALGLGALLAIDAKISAGAVFAASFIVGRALAPIDQLVGSWRYLVQARGAYATLRSLFTETGPDVALTRLPPPQGKLDVEGLTVADGNRRVIIGGIGFSVDAGEMVAIIGPSGAGKSTLVRALAGATVPSAGIIRYDGADQRNWDPERLAEHVGYLPQEPSLFAGSIKENIARFSDRLGGDPARIDEDAVAAAKAAGAHELILKLPGGYDGQLGLGGRGLSAGQAQRIALARALFGDPRYLILDEPNSNLDAEGDQQLVTTLAALKKSGKTILIVAHRMSVLPIVDKLLVLQDGRVKMFGAREEVLRQIMPPQPGGTRIVAGGKANS
ncbi:type I secretion system permease/ATPase [Sphingomonas piscis]|uniref:Type I secretion system permease/ATPase n=1 Tax=Sphingomonas piscis TaxID=2714943 RepID=A0A6G7YRX1_9SPHN|nr:type I secretion system permease/ATPase [Sphingomonas piscis]QIK79490.1 type I secretion system permease/ATPase [Sphingomonas piscis]